MTTLGWVSDLQIFCKRYQGRVFPSIVLLQVRKSWIQEILAWGIQNPRLWNKLKEFGILGYTDKVSVFQYLENVRNPQRVIQNPRTSRGELSMSKSSMQCTAFPSDVTSAKTMKRRPYWSTINSVLREFFLVLINKFAAFLVSGPGVLFGSNKQVCRFSREWTHSIIQKTASWILCIGISRRMSYGPEQPEWCLSNLNSLWTCSIFQLHRCPLSDPL